MRPPNTDWNGVALAKLSNVLGPTVGLRTMQEILTELGMDRLESAADLHRFAAALSTKDGFAGALGGLLSLHATMYDDRAPPAS